MSFRLLCAGLLMILSVLPLRAQTVDDVAAALKIGELVIVMQDEGRQYGSELEAELFPEAGGDRWAAIVELIYDPATMRRRFDETLAAEIGADPGTLAAALGFFGSERGQRIVTLEIEARRALLDKAVEDAAKVSVDQMRAENSPRLEVLTRFADVNDLIEQNVAGALNCQSRVLSRPVRRQAPSEPG